MHIKFLNKIKDQLLDWYEGHCDEIYQPLEDPCLDLNSQTCAINSTSDIQKLSNKLDKFGYPSKYDIPINLWNNVSYENRLNLSILGFNPNPKYILEGNGYNGYKKDVNESKTE